MKFALAFAALLAVAFAAPRAMHLHDPSVMSFDEFKSTFSKSYATQEEHDKRAAVFAANMEFVLKHNADATQTYKVGVNQFADLTSAEFKQLYLSTMPPKKDALNVRELPTENIAASVDWRAKGAVTPIKNQGQCGSCWSFSTTGSVEGAHQIATGTLVSFSEQQLMDCSTAEGNQGCNGGLMDDAFKYIIANKGLNTEAAYPYTGQDGTCNKAKASVHAGSITGFTDVPQDSDAQLAAAVAKGPVSVAIEADQSGFQMYRSGVFSGPCGTQLDHGVLVVGYTSAYWIVKNSWGATWGDQGYIMMSRTSGGTEGICGILHMASYPTGASEVEVAAPPPANAGHYEDPSAGPCSTGELSVQITGVSGDFCSPSCSKTAPCPTDVPDKATARPECVLEMAGHSQPTQCALICTPGANGQCPTKASCKPISGTGVCTYDS